MIGQLATIQWGLRYGKTDYADELFEALMEKLNTRNKHITLEDSSEGRLGDCEAVCVQ